jgi:hypothetical protein
MHLFAHAECLTLLKMFASKHKDFRRETIVINYFELLYRNKQFFANEW